MGFSSLVKSKGTTASRGAPRVKPAGQSAGEVPQHQVRWPLAIYRRMAGKENRPNASST